MMLQPVAAPGAGNLVVTMPAWRKAAKQGDAARTPDVLGWLAAAALTATVTAGVVGLLVVEYAALWAVLVTPWMHARPATLPWAF